MDFVCGGWPPEAATGAERWSPVGSKRSLEVSVEEVHNSGIC